jgi:hypothetical protein
MTTLAAVIPESPPAVREPTDDERWDAWRTRSAVQDARTARRMRAVMAAVIVIGLAAAAVVLR